MLLQTLDCPAEWRLRHVQPLGGVGEAELLSHCNEVPQVTDFHIHTCRVQMSNSSDRGCAPPIRLSLRLDLYLFDICMSGRGICLSRVPS